MNEKISLLTPLVSIIVPVYNLEKYVFKCVESLLNQSYLNIEVIVVSDGSTDQSSAKCVSAAKGDERLVFIEKENGGVSSARNRGLSTSKGQYVMFVDGDDWLEPDAVDKMLSKIQETDSDVCFNMLYYRNDDEVIRAANLSEETNISAENLVIRHLCFEFVAAPWLMMVRSDCVRDCLFDENIHSLEDWEYNFRLLTKVEKVTLISKPLYHYREVDGSASKSPLNARKMSCFQIPCKIEKYCRDNHLPYEDYKNVVTVCLLNHMLVILANNTYAVREAAQLKQIARTAFSGIMKDRRISLKRKFYAFLATINPRCFCFLYRIKHIGGKK